MTKKLYPRIIYSERPSKINHANIYSTKDLSAKNAPATNLFAMNLSTKKLLAKNLLDIYFSNIELLYVEISLNWQQYGLFKKHQILITFIRFFIAFWPQRYHGNKNLPHSFHLYSDLFRTFHPLLSYGF